MCSKMINFNDEKDLRNVLSDFIYSQVKVSDKSKREALTETIYSLSKETIEQLIHQLKEDTRILTSE